jgi:hypothetical protein
MTSMQRFLASSGTTSPFNSAHRGIVTRLWDGSLCNALVWRRVEVETVPEHHPTAHCFASHTGRFAALS